MTYENAGEAQILKSYWRPGAALENTLFVILAPDGRPLTRGARSPDWMFGNAHDMATGLNGVAMQYRSGTNPRSLPTVETVRLGMNVAACDKRPLAVVLGDGQEDRKTMENRLAPLAWSGDFIGKIVYTSGTRNELTGVYGVNLARGYVFVAPNEFGTAGAVVAQLDARASTAELASALKVAIDRYRPVDMDHREHIRMGREQGIQWTSAIPVTDPHSPENNRGGFGGPDRGPGPGMEE
jgi:hypothetical protein